MRSIVALLAVATCAMPVSAHVVLEQKSAPAGGYYKAVFRVGHGCADSPTQQLTVELPKGIRGAKPMPKPGWLLATHVARPDAPYESHGKRIEEEVVAVTWSGGSLPDAHYDEFVIFMKLPEQPGRRWFKARQVCETGRIDWEQIPEDGRTTRGLRAPAALLDIVPADSGHAR